MSNNAVRHSPYPKRNLEKQAGIHQDDPKPDSMASTNIQEIQAALGPMFESMKAELVATQQIAINELKEEFLIRIKDLTETVNQSAARISTLENQLMQLKNSKRASEPAKTNLNPPMAQSVQHPLPPAPVNSRPSVLGMMPWANVFKQGAKPASKPLQQTANSKNAVNKSSSPLVPVVNNELHASNDDGFQLVTRKQKKHEVQAGKLVSSKYPITEREIIISFTEPLKAAPTETTADTALEKINKTIVDHKDIHQPPFIRARFSVNNNLVITTSNNNCGLDYDAYLNIIVDAVKFLGPATARINERWSKFLIHGVPTHSSLESIRYDIETNYASLKLAQTPRWLAKPENRKNKLASTIVIALVGTVTLKQIGATRLLVRNRFCTIGEYVQYGPQTQCTKCQQYGHHTLRCQALNPTCAVCAEPHMTKSHPCKISTCKEGPSCTHPPIKCAACGDMHKASDPKCPTRVKLSQEFRFRRAYPTNADLNMEEQL
jgi:hypothetical protein